MKTVNCIFSGRPDRDLPKVVDLAAWKAEHIPEPGSPGTEPARPRTPRRDRTALDWAELIATLAVAAAFAALAARVLLF